MEVRMLISASTAPRTFDLRCDVREKMITWLQEVYPHALPRRRAEMNARAARVNAVTQDGVLQRFG
jgi:hypothetical protein